jgi:hypothetical protein
MVAVAVVEVVSSFVLAAANQSDESDYTIHRQTILSLSK